MTVLLLAIVSPIPKPTLPKISGACPGGIKSSLPITSLARVPAGSGQSGRQIPVFPTSPRGTKRDDGKLIFLPSIGLVAVVVDTHPTKYAVEGVGEASVDYEIR